MEVPTETIVLPLRSDKSLNVGARGKDLNRSSDCGSDGPTERQHRPAHVHTLAVLEQVLQQHCNVGVVVERDAVDPQRCDDGVPIPGDEGERESVAIRVGRRMAVFERKVFCVERDSRGKSKAQDENPKLGRKEEDGLVGGHLYDPRGASSCSPVYVKWSPPYQTSPGSTPSLLRLDESFNTFYFS